MVDKKVPKVDLSGELYEWVHLIFNCTIALFKLSVRIYEELERIGFEYVKERIVIHAWTRRGIREKTSSGKQRARNQGK